MNAQHFVIKKLGPEFSTQMTCQEASCVAYAEGWLSVLDVAGDAQHAAAAKWIKQHSHRKFYEWAGGDALESAYRLQAQGMLTVTPALKECLAALTPGMVVFYFHPGQQCFREHLDRTVKFLHQKNGVTREHVRPLEWNEHHNEVAFAINEARRRG